METLTNLVLAGYAFHRGHEIYRVPGGAYVVLGCREPFDNANEALSWVTQHSQGNEHR